MKKALLWTLAAGLVAAMVALLGRPLAGVRGRNILDEARRLHHAGRPADALAGYDRAFELAAEREDRRLRSRALVGSAEVLYGLRGDLDEALRRLEEGLALAREIGDPGLEADALSSLGNYHESFRRQRHRSPDELYRPALELYRQAGDRRGLAEVQGRLGVACYLRADYETSARYLEASRGLFEELGDGVGLSDVYRYLGALYVQLERYDQARAHYLKSLELGAENGYEIGRRRAETLLAHLHLRRGEFERSIEILDRLIAAGDADRDDWVNRGNALLHLGRPGEARASYRRALAIDDRAPDADAPFRARTLTMLAHAHMQAGELDQAAAALARAEAVPIAAKGWNPMVLHTLARADLADFQGRRQQALHHLLAAAEIENQTFGSARSFFFQTQYRQVFDRLFSLLFEGVVTRGVAEELTFRFLEQMRYRSFRSVVVRLGASVTGERVQSPGETAAVARIERVSQLYAEAPTPALWEELRRGYAEYEDRVLRAELSASRYRLLAGERPVALAGLRSALAPDDALVEYVVAGERAFALVVTRRTLTSAVLPVSASELETKVKLFRHLLFSDGGHSGGGEDSDGWRPLAAELGRLLVAPLESTGALAGTARLVLVPMGFLHDLPFAALADGDGTLLMERYALVRSPSASLWARGRASESRSAGPDRELIAFGLRQPRGSRLEPLGFAEREAAAVAGAFGGEARLGAAATEAAFKTLAPGARWIHVAAHGAGEARVPLHSRLWLEPGDGDDGELTVREILDLGLSAELVSLSACGTGLSPAPSGAPGALEVDRLGFVEAFLHAGAGGVLATLLPVSDAGTAAFMTAFYRHLRSSSPAESLAATRRQMLEDGGSSDAESALPDLRHPRYWAPFVLVSARPLPPMASSFVTQQLTPVTGHVTHDR